MKLNVFATSQAIRVNKDPSHLLLQGEKAFSRAVKNLKLVLIEEGFSER